MINVRRAEGGLPPFAWNEILPEAERPWAAQMVAENACYHGDFGGRAIALGYTGFAWGEVGACGYPSPEDVVQGWMDSPGHRGIIMDNGGAMDEIGVGMAYYANRFTSVWAIVGDSGN